MGGVSAAVGKAEKVGKFALNYGGKALEKIKNVLHPDKVKKLAKKVYDDYIKYPIYKSYMSLKDGVKKIGNLPTPFAYQVATTYGNMKIQKTVSEVVQDTKESIVQMPKKLDEAIGGMGKDNLDKMYKRPSGYRKGVRDEVWDKAKDTDGNVRDPLTDTIMNKDEPWDMGHKPGYEFRKHQQSAMERGISRKEFLDEHNNPDHYHPELPSSNRSHKGEDLTDDYFGD